VNTGEAIGFSITVANSGAQGTGTAKSVTLNDPLPGGNGISWSISPAYAGPGSCSITGSAPSQTLTCSFGDMAPGASITVHVSSGTTAASAGTYNNTATASATNHPDVDDSDDIVVLAPNLEITKTADAASVDAGSPIGFTITVSNTGQGLAKAVSLTDPLPTGTGISWSISPAKAGCSIAAGTLSCNFGDMASNTSNTVHITSATSFASCKAYANTATAGASNHANVEASATTTVNCPGVSLTKTADNSSVDAGDQIGFTITVANAGPGTATGVTLNDPLPTGTGISWSIGPATQGCSINSGTLSCNFGDMAANTSHSVHISSATSFASCATYTNVATASATNAPSLEASASVTVHCPALSITKTADATPVNTTEPIGFTVTVANSGAQGTGTAKSVTLSDPLPAGNGVNWSINPAYEGPGTCSIDGTVPNQTLNCSFGDMDPGDSIPVHIMSQTTTASAGTYPNTATAAATNHPSVNASATIVVLAPSMTITKTADDDLVNAGDAIGFTITVSNSGQGTAKGVTLDDPLPTGSGIAWTIDPAKQGCSIADDTLACDFGDMASNTSNSVHITSPTTFESCGDYPNAASAEATNHALVEANDSTTVDCPALSITKTADDDSVTAGDQIGFTVTVSNSGDEGTGIARSVTMNDPLPAGEGVEWSIDPAYEGPGTCSIDGSAPDQTLHCELGDMAPGDSASVHVVSDTTDDSIGDYDNTATASATNHPPVDDSAKTTVIAEVPVTVQSSTTTTTVPTPVTTQAPPPPGPLPFTGGSTGPLALFALVLVAAGGALAMSRRRRRAL
jgi:uncharacterized repeat protein (TIGR01451 family)